MEPETLTILKFDTPTPKKKSGSVSPIIIVVTLLVVGGIYLLMTRLNKAPDPIPYIPDDTQNAAR